MSLLEDNGRGLQLFQVLLRDSKVNFMSQVNHTILFSIPKVGKQSFEAASETINILQKAAHSTLKNSFVAVHKTLPMASLYKRYYALKMFKSSIP